MHAARSWCRQTVHGRVKAHQLPCCRRRALEQARPGNRVPPEAGQAETREHKTHSSGWHLGAQLPGAASVWPWGRGAGGWRGQSRSGGRDCGKPPAGRCGSAASGLVTESKFYLESVLREVGIPVGGGGGGGGGGGVLSVPLCSRLRPKGNPRITTNSSQSWLGITNRLKAIFGRCFHLALRSACWCPVYVCICRHVLKNEFIS